MNDHTAVLLCIRVASCRVRPADGSLKRQCELCQAAVWVSMASLSQLIQDHPHNHAIVCVECAQAHQFHKTSTFVRPGPGILAELEARGVPPEKVDQLLRAIFPNL